ncbi:DsbA family oxidoreductase [Lysinibacillus sp. KU-BSD001]|uniref:DsbA family oxidoreductase n=1 Tax=Lysinibacillus sp. KU-BSD001 TaxID=3141328 RepID=UPI0036ECAC27
MSIKIEIFSDFACPFCYIGKKRLEQAIEELGFEQEVDIEYKTYLLDPEASKEETKPFYEAMMEKYESSREDVQLMASSIQQRANEVGLTYDFEKMQIGNTENAHRLAKWARQFNKEAALIDAVMDRYFTKGLNVNDSEALLAIVEALHLPIEEAKAVLESEQYAEDIAKDRYDIQQLNVTSVPFFVFENKYGIIGAEPIEVFTKTLKQAQEVAAQKLNIAGGTDVCGPDGCKL